MSQATSKNGNLWTTAYSNAVSRVFLGIMNDVLVFDPKEMSLKSFLHNKAMEMMEEDFQRDMDKVKAIAQVSSAKEEKKK